MWITQVSIKNPVFATMVMAALLVLGLVSYSLLPVERMPDVASPYVYIQLEYPGASPEAIENDLIKPIEDQINTVNGVKHIYATAREGFGFLSVEFRLDVDSGNAIQEIRDKVAGIKPSFPVEAKDPLIVRADISGENQPVVQLALRSTTRSLRELSMLSDQVIIKQLQLVPGVGSVRSGGTVTRQVQLLLHPDQMSSLSVGVDQVISAVQATNQDMPAGTIVNGRREQLVRVEGKLKTPEQFGRVIVGRQGGSPIYLNQVAEVVDGEQERTSIARLNGAPAISIDILPIQGANIVELGNGIKKAVDSLKPRLPADVELIVTQSNSDDVERALAKTRETILEGALLTILIVFMFLHSWRSTVITALTLPISVIAAFIVVHAFGFSLNMLTLMALSLSIGLLIDDAIVVRENIVRHLGMGKSHVRAALEGTQEIGLAVMATTFAIVVVFVPVAFMHGIIGRFFYQFGITVAVAVLVSLFVSFTLDPMLSSVWQDPEGDRFRHFPWLRRLMDRFEQGVAWAHRIYGRALTWALADERVRVPRWVVLPLALIALPVTLIVLGLRRSARQWIAGGCRTVPTWSRRSLLVVCSVVIFLSSFLIVPKIGAEFAPQSDTGFIFVQVNTPVGSSLEYTDAKVQQIEAALREFKDIALIQTTVGNENGKNYANIGLKLVDRNHIHRRSQQAMEVEVRRVISGIAGIELSVGGDKPIFISILGPDAAKLTEISQDVMQRIAKIKGIVDLESSEKAATPTIAVHLNSEAASDLGLSNAQIGRALRPLISGDTISHWLGQDGQNYDVIAQLPRSGRRFASDLADLYLTSSRTKPDGSPMLVPLRQVADFTPTTSAQQLKRLDLQRRISLYANVQGRPSGTVGSEVRKLIDGIKLPPGYHFETGGQQADMADAFTAFLGALGLAVVFIYFILASQFGSFVQPVAIMASLPFSLTGVLLALLVTGTTLNIFSMIGFIMLMGLVVKNAILLVDFANKGREEGLPVRDALLAAGQVRLRPILMTTAAMIFGMLPMAIGAGDGGETQAPMGRAIIGGVMTSTLLTLVVVPVLYTYVDDFTAAVRARWGRRHTSADAGAVSLSASATDAVTGMVK